MLINCRWWDQSLIFPNWRPHFLARPFGILGKNRGGWIKRIAGPEQSNPWGRLTRLFFSYPLPFEIRGAFARTDTETGRRNIDPLRFITDWPTKRLTLMSLNTNREKSLSA